MSSRDPIDVHVGTRLRLARKACGMSQTALGTALGISFQQVQKYESGANRVGAGRLYRLARLFDVSVGFFFDDLPDHVSGAILMPQAEPSAAAGRLGGLSLSGLDQHRLVLDLVATYVRISDPRLRSEFVALLKAVVRAQRGR